MVHLVQVVQEIVYFFIREKNIPLFFSANNKMTIFLDHLDHLDPFIWFRQADTSPIIGSIFAISWSKACGLNQSGQTPPYKRLIRFV